MVSGLERFHCNLFYTVHVYTSLYTHTLYVYTGWITQLSTVMEIAVAVADLIHIQDSSVLVCLENGWDATAQVKTL